MNFKLKHIILKKLLSSPVWNQFNVFGGGSFVVWEVNDELSEGFFISVSLESHDKQIKTASVSIDIKFKMVYWLLLKSIRSSNVQLGKTVYVIKKWFITLMLALVCETVKFKHF